MSREFEVINLSQSLSQKSNLIKTGMKAPRKIKLHCFEVALMSFKEMLARDVFLNERTTLRATTV